MKLKLFLLSLCSVGYIQEIAWAAGTPSLVTCKPQIRYENSFQQASGDEFSLQVESIHCKGPSNGISRPDLGSNEYVVTITSKNQVKFSNNVFIFMSWQEGQDIKEEAFELEPSKEIADHKLTLEINKSGYLSTVFQAMRNTPSLNIEIYDFYAANPSLGSDVMSVNF